MFWKSTFAWGTLRQGSPPAPPALPERPDTLLRLCECGIVHELAVSECGFPVASAFNDLGLHWFPPDWRQRLTDGTTAGSTLVPTVT